MLGWQLGVGNRVGHLGFAIRILELHKSVRLICTGPSPGERLTIAYICSAGELRTAQLIHSEAFTYVWLRLTF